MTSKFGSALGRDFWNFRTGQLVSLLGDSCSGIALAWWILNKTGSAAQMSSVIAPAMIVRLVLLPLFGPLGDKFSRKHLILLADLWRFFFSGCLAAMVHFDYFSLPLLIATFACTSIGSALFEAAAGGIVPKLVPREKLQVAYQQTQTINSLAGILGGIAGGLVVSFVGVFAAFAIDAGSYLLAALCTSFIRANTKPERSVQPHSQNAFRQWTKELIDGFQVLYRIPVMFWLCMIAMFMNLGLSPLAIVLPVLAKEGRGMPAWFLGGLESSIGLGAIVGALTIGLLQKRLRAHVLMILAIAMIGVGVAVLPWIPTLLLPLSVLFWVGVGGTWANIPIGTQFSLAVPDGYRSRLGSIMNFMCTGISPLGVASAGILISTLGLGVSLVIMGTGVVLLTPLILFIPKFKDFLSSPHDEVGTFFDRHYPGVFEIEFK